MGSREQKDDNGEYEQQLPHIDTFDAVGRVLGKVESARTPTAPSFRFRDNSTPLNAGAADFERHTVSPQRCPSPH